MGKACKVASCNQKKSLNHVFEVPKHSINMDKWNFFNGIFKFKNFIIRITFENILNLKKIKVYDVVCSQWYII